MEDKLVKRIRDGDDSGLDELVALFYPAILKYCRLHSVNLQAAEDATQQTFVNFFENFNRYTHQGKLKAYLYSIARNLCINATSKPRFGELTEIASAETDFETIEAEHDFQALIESLPMEQKEIVILRYKHDLKMREISEITGLPLRTVQSKLRATLKKLKKQMGENYE